MKRIIRESFGLNGEVEIPGSKSHSIRAVVMGALSKGVSRFSGFLESRDTLAVVKAFENMGVISKKESDEILIHGTGGNFKKPDLALDLMNSGTSLNIITSIVAATGHEFVLDGDSSLRKRPVEPLLKALGQMGAEYSFLGGLNAPPFRIKGPIKGGKCSVDGINSQFVSSLLIAAPMFMSDCEIFVENLHEAPYIEMTLQWLREAGVEFENSQSLDYFGVKAKSGYKNPFNKRIPGDWSSAAFPIAAAVIRGKEVVIKGVDVNDVQGDKAIIDIFRQMGANILVKTSGDLLVRGVEELKSITVDLNKTPDALPIVAVMAAFAKGKSVIHNVKQARIKETDRIAVMAQELSKCGVNIEEREDGLLIEGRGMKNFEKAKVKGHDDHRIIMAMAVAGLAGEIEIDNTDAVDVTYPSFFEQLIKINANIE